MGDFLTNTLSEQMHSLDASTRIVLLHPNFVSQSQILPMFLDAANTIQVSLDTGIQRHVEIVDHIELACDTYDLRSPAVQHIILGSCDSVSPQVILDFLIECLPQYPNARFWLLSRRLIKFLAFDSDWKSLTAILPTADALMLHDYRLINSSAALLEVRALGSGQVLLNGEPVQDWDGELPRNLFFFLVDRGMTTRAQIFETFWPNLPTREATNVFHVTKRKISEVLGIDLTSYWSGFYRVSPNIELSYDVARFNEMVQSSAVAEPQDAKQFLSYAQSLYRGEFLFTINGEANAWVEQRRQELTQSNAEILISLAKLFKQDGDQERALGHFIRAFASNRQREDLAGEIMNMYANLGMYDQALDTYRVLENELLNTLGISPARWLNELLTKIRERSVTDVQERATTH
jgi:DNA-binding SARP family transcriptional activator